MEYKIGQRVRCVPGFVNYPDYNYGGAGYRAGKVITIVRMMEHNGKIVVWDKGGQGIFTCAVDPYDNDDLVEEIEIIHKIKEEIGL